MVKVSDIASKFDYQIVGNDSIEVTGINWAERALPSEIAVAYASVDVFKTNAEVVLTAPCLIDTDKVLIFCDDFVELAMIKIAEYFVRHSIYPDYNCSNNNYQLINGSMISDSAHIGKNVTIAPFVVINDNVIIGDNCFIESNVSIGSGSIIHNNVRIRAGAVISGDPYFGVMDSTVTSFCGVKGVIIEDDVSIGTNSIVQRGVLSNTVIGKGTKIGDLVVIGHDTIVGENCKIVSQSGISGCASIGDHTVIYGQSGVSNNVHIGNNVTVKGKTSVIKDIPDDVIVSGILGKIKNK